MAMTTNRMRSTHPYPPGHPRREQLRTGLRNLPATHVRVNFESRDGRYRLLNYGTGPDRRRLTDGATQELRTLARAVIRDALPARPFHDGKPGRLVWNLETDRFEIGY